MGISSQKILKPYEWQYIFEVLWVNLQVKIEDVKLGKGRTD